MDIIESQTMTKMLNGPATEYGDLHRARAVGRLAIKDPTAWQIVGETAPSKHPFSMTQDERVSIGARIRARGAAVIEKLMAHFGTKPKQSQDRTAVNERPKPTARAVGAVRPVPISKAPTATDDRPTPRGLAEHLERQKKIETERSTAEAAKSEPARQWAQNQISKHSEQLKTCGIMFEGFHRNHIANAQRVLNSLN